MSYEKHAVEVYPAARDRNFRNETFISYYAVNQTMMNVTSCQVFDRIAAVYLINGE